MLRERQVSHLGSSSSCSKSSSSSRSRSFCNSSSPFRSAWIRRFGSRRIHRPTQVIRDVEPQVNYEDPEKTFGLRRLTSKSFGKVGDTFPCLIPLGQPLSHKQGGTCSIQPMVNVSEAGKEEVTQCEIATPLCAHSDLPKRAPHCALVT
jgi:hypothetical protein